VYLDTTQDTDFFAGIFVDEYPYFEQHPSFNKEAHRCLATVLELFQTNLN